MKKSLQSILFFFILLTLSALIKPAFVNAQAFGFNIHSLSKESPDNIAGMLSYVGNSCQATYVRLWGYPGTLGVNGLTDLEKVLTSAPSNIKFIVALEDFPFGPAAGNPTSWYASGYRTSYRQHVSQMLDRYGGNSQIAIWEVMNEPQCLGQSSCYPAFESFMADISGLIKSKTNALVSAGLGFDGMSFPTSVYENINNNMTAISCHYYSDDGTKDRCLTAAARAGNKFFYIGEAGFMSPGGGPEGSCTSSSCTNVCSNTILGSRAGQVNADRSQFAAAGTDAFLLWQFSPEGNSNLICDRFSVFPKDPICGGIDLTLTPTDPDLACNPISQAATTSGFNPLRSLLSLFGQIQLPDINLFARFTDPFETLRAVGLASDDEYNRLPGYANKDAKEPMSYVTIQRPQSQTRQSFFLPFFGRVDADLKQAAKSVGSWIPNYAISAVSPQGEPEDTMDGYINGIGGFDRKYDFMLREYRQSNDPNKASSDVAKEIYKKCGVLCKLWPPEALSINTNSFKARNDAWRDQTMAEVFNYWICKLKISTNNCNFPATDHDLQIGWIYSVAQFPEGPPPGPEAPVVKTKASAAATTSTWYTETKITEFSRPMLVSGVGCTNRTWFVERYFSLDQKNQVCQILYGDDYLNGTCQPGSACYNEFDFPLPNPPEGAQYAGGIWNLVPLASIKDSWGEVRWNFYEREEDPDRGENDNLVLGQNETYTLPGRLTSVREGGVRMAILRPHETNKKAVTYNPTLPESQCVQNAVGGRVNDAIAGFQITGANLLFKAAKLLNLPLATAQNNVQGVTNQVGQVLQAQNPQPSGSPSSQAQGSHSFVRDSALQLGIPKTVNDIIKYICDPQTGYANLILPHETVQGMKKTIAGVPIYMLPTAFKTDFDEGDFRYSYNKDTVYPGLGGPLICDQLVKNAVLPHGATSGNQLNAGRLLRELASQSDAPSLSTQPWRQLSSYQTETPTDLSLR